jgi:hypothetical protein
MIRLNLFYLVGVCIPTYLYLPLHGAQQIKTHWFAGLPGLPIKHTSINVAVYVF